MAVYRFFEIDEYDHHSPAIMDCLNDEAAIWKARQGLGERVVEVWDCSRLLVRLAPDSMRSIMQGESPSKLGLTARRRLRSARPRGQ
jgi:hypothetical protein